MGYKILLPNNLFGALIMLLLIVLVVVVPFTITLWLSMKVAPMWVGVPLSVAVSVISFLTLVKFNRG